MINDSIEHVAFEGKIWSVVVDEDYNKSYLDVRREGAKSIELVQLNLETLEYASRTVDHAWWTKLTAVKEGKLFFVEFQDQNDPNQMQNFSYDWDNGEYTPVNSFELNENFIHPSIYEHGTDYHKTVAEFLSLELPLACEYLEWKEKIIISYYIRSDREFIRYLLLINEGEKVWKIQQDDQMKGFSPGAFFVFNDQLIFIKDRNEVCVYSG